MKISYSSSKAVKITADMRNDLNAYNQRKNEINNYSIQIGENQKKIDENSNEIKSLESNINSEDKREAKDANKRIKVLQKEIDKLIAANGSLENKKDILLRRQNSANMSGVQLKSFPEKIENVEENVSAELDNSAANSEAIGEYKEEESFVPIPLPSIEEIDEELKPTQEDLEAIWANLHKFDEKGTELPEPISEDFVKPVYEEETQVDPVYEDEVTNVSDEKEVVEEPVVEPTVVAEEPQITPIYEEEAVNMNEEKETMEEPMIIEPIHTDVEEPIVSNEASESIIEPTVISEEPVMVPIDDVKEEDVKSKVENEIHEQVSNEFPEIEVPAPMDSEKKLNEIYKEIDVEPQLPVETEVRDLKDLTLFVDYNDYTFAFAQQHYNKEALKPEEIFALVTIKSYLTEKEFETKRTSQYKKIINENKRLNKKIVSLSKEFTKTSDKLSKDYVKTTDDLTAQVNKAKEQIEIDRVEKVQTQKLNDSLTENIKEQAAHIEDLLTENAGLKETIENRDNTIQDLEKTVSEQSERIKVFEEKLNTVLGIVKEVKGDKNILNKE